MGKKTNTYKYQKNRGLKRKIYLIDLKGGKCERCGYDKNLAALEFHHKNPNEKETQLDMRTLSNNRMEWILKEFEKCEVLCSNCHKEHHSPDLLIEDVRHTLKQYELDQHLKIKKQGKPKCADCNVEINYGYKRCVTCNSKTKRKVVRPNLTILKEEKNVNGTTWCAKKYKVSNTTINRWIKRNIQ
jgi:hypothetical protein